MHSGRHEAFHHHWITDEFHEAAAEPVIGTVGFLEFLGVGVERWVRATVKCLVDVTTRDASGFVSVSDPLPVAGVDHSRRVSGEDETGAVRRPHALAHEKTTAARLRANGFEIDLPLGRELVDELTLEIVKVYVSPAPVSR